MLIVEPGDPRDPAASALLQASHALMAELFPAEDNHALDIEDLCTPDIRFFIAREGKRLARGTGALTIRQGYGEVKSMFVSLRAPAAKASLPPSCARSRTKPAPTACTALQTRNRPRRTGRRPSASMSATVSPAAAIFGDYAPNTTSVFMEKSLQLS